MSESQDYKRSFKDKLSDKYRLVVLDDDTLGEIKSTRISLIGICAIILMSFFLISLLTSFLIAFTPVKHLIPGYADIEKNQAYVNLNEKIELLEEEINTQRVYTESLKNILNPTGITVDDINKSEPNSKNNLTNTSISDNYSNFEGLENYYFCPPLKGEISAKFDLSIKHYGIDIVAPEGSHVKCISDGIVINADWSTNTGNTISIQHVDNLVSVYKHNSVLLKKIGEKVSACEAIAIIGNTGKLTSGPHVHFELWNNGIAVDPNIYINFE